MRWVGLVSSMGEKRNAYKNFDRKTSTRPRRRSDGDIIFDLRN
jgi:hypothetical protein